ncbi:MAG: sigma-70 family RNA polymerase sigma factor [Oscillospiraceae bacterium]|jgi:RNA polymerase sigma factor
MKEEYQIVSKVLAAQSDSRAADELIEQYLPFIRSETAKFLKRFPEDIQDELSIAMFAFYEAAMSYQADKGSFLKLAATAIRNRLIDHYRKERRHIGIVSLEAQSSEDNDSSLVDQIRDNRNKVEELHDRTATKKEIQEFTEQLQQFGLSLSEIADNCPKQDRTLMSSTP